MTVVVTLHIMLGESSPFFVFFEFFSGVAKLVRVITLTWEWGVV